MIAKRYLSSFFLLGLLAIAFVANAQRKSEISSKIKTINGKEYYIHRVVKGETLYGLSHAYKVSIEEIESLNPKVKDGLKADAVIEIPVRVRKKAKPKLVVKEPKQEPVVAKTDSLIVPIEESVIVEHSDSIKEPEWVDEASESSEVMESETVNEEPEVVSVEPIKKDTVVVSLGGHYMVQLGEDLYDIAKKYGIDLADFKAINPELDNNPVAGTMIKVPNIVNEQDYIIHKVEYNERTKSMLKRWKVDEDEFRAMNISVGSHVFVNQVVLIPIERVDFNQFEFEEYITESIDESEEPEELELPELEPSNDSLLSVIDPMEIPECYADPDNATRRYKVALMIPLYLNEVSSLEISKDKIANLQKSRSLSFLPFYEGFMMAVEKLTKEDGLKLDLTVIDVTENVNTAQSALEKIKHQQLDLIVGPFFSRSFAVVEGYAKEHNILVVNPLSTRHEVVEGNANVIKLKPANAGLILDISNLVRNHYPDANVFILSREKVADSLFLTQLESELNRAVNDEVTVSGSEFLHFAKDESLRLEMGSRMVSTITVEGQVYSTKELKNGNIDHVTLSNPVHRYAYDSRNLRLLVSQLSGVRNNVIIAYGEDNVFATQVLNALKTEADRFPITLVCAPDWSKFEKLLVENLLQMNAIYLSDNFVDYRSSKANQFVRDFRSRYVVEPQNYAFEGYDVATYFLTALMRYGSQMTECLPYFSMPLLHAKYHFMRKGVGSGLENQTWNLYQYDDDLIELVPVNPFKQPTE